MRGISILLFFVIWTGFELSAQKMSRNDYIAEYKELAMKEMLRSGIPASITLAQGMLESDNGNSTLATRGKNHFGIKCHDDWKGRRIHHDDDRRRECFRRYKSVYDSYVDHSDFLSTKPRYAFLFELEITDYKGWAKGLKKAGYATSRKYADLLIDIIEENDLHQYDLIALEDYNPETDTDLAGTSSELIGKRPILINNRIDYIVVKPGDTFASLTEELELIPGELFRYNDFPAGSELNPGDILYLQPKRNRAETGNDYHTVREGETLYDISQIYGVKLEKLYRKNHLEPGDEVKSGTRIYLRKRKPGNLPKVKIEEEEQEGDEFEFRFDGG